jgi:hypothetical protein
MNSELVKKQNKKIPLIVFGVLLASFVIYGKITNHLSDQWFLDRIAASNFQASDEIVKLAEKSSMNDEGRILFYASKPQLNERAEFNQNCADLLNELSMILGCYNGQIFIFNINDERIEGVKYVTAAHEMLHAAYGRLGIFEKHHINELIEKEVANTQDKNILEQLEMYEQLEPGQEINEMHSMLGTESRNLSPELEKYYGRYFYDRSLVVNEYEKYKEVFNEIEKHANEVEQKMTALEIEIEALSNDYELKADKLSRDIETFNNNARIENSFDEVSFYAYRNEIIVRQESLSKQVDTINQMVNEYNSYVAEMQVLGRDVQSLQASLDSKQ